MQLNFKNISTLVVALSLVAQGAFAGGSQNHSVKTVAHSGQAVSHGVAASAMASSGVVAIPLVLSGAVGHASGKAGKELWDIANTPIGDPLPISDEAITAGPTPTEMMRKGGDLK